jgi:hypothetical protein
LFFVISDPQAHGGTFLIANITGDQFRAGEECTLAKGEHPWIKKECFVAFADALKITPAQCQMIEALVGTRVRLQPSLSPETLAKIVSAAKQSKAIPVGFKKYL